MSAMRITGWSCLFLLIYLGSPAFGNEGATKVLPFPQAESEKLICGWLLDSGYELTRDSRQSGELQLSVRRDSRSWIMILKPKSALQSEILVDSTSCDLAGADDFQNLWSFMENRRDSANIGYSQTDLGTPDFVRLYSKATLCITAKRSPTPVQLSGFFIDDEGLVLSTAHDLKENQAVNLTSHLGETFRGRVARLDHHRDLCLIDSNARPDILVPLKRGRFLLDQGEKIYSVGCESNSFGVINIGSVTGPPRLADDFPLWQVSLKTLPGSSGSPVFDAEGHLVAIVKGRYRGTESVGFLIPLSTIMEFLRR